MPKLPIISGKQALRAFEKIGWRIVRQRGGHMILTREDYQETLSIPDHPELDRGTLRSIIRTSGLTVDEFCNLLG